MRILRGLVPPIVVLGLGVLIWAIVVRIFHVRPLIFPSPGGVYHALLERRLDLLASLWSTAKASLIGFALSAVIGMGIAVLLSTSRLVQRAFYPYTILFQTVPIIAVAPLLVMWFGFGLKPVAISAFIASVFPVIANTLTGLRSTDPALTDLFKLYGASGLERLLKLRLPWAMPNIITGLRIAAGLAVIGTIVGEFVAGTLQRGAGLGISVLVGKRLADMPYIFAAVFAASLLGLAMLASVNLVGWLLLRRWHASEQNRD